jgi:hypothetical protein
MGAGEFYGQNKNGDYWTKECCEKDCPTFVSNGHMFREHRNSSPDIKIGDIKAAAYHPQLNRVELILHGHIKKAEEEYELAREGKPLSFSMSARVPWDECSCCGNRAKRASEYCDHLKYHMHQYLPEFKKYAFAFNKKAKFFDMSRVAKPADRIAHYLEYRMPEDCMAKAASAQEVIPGWRLAELEGVDLGPDVEPGFTCPSCQSILTKLANLEKDFENPQYFGFKDMPTEWVDKVASNLYDEELTDAELSDLRRLQPGTMFRELAKKAAILPFHSFAAYAMGLTMGEVHEDETVKQANCGLPGIFQHLMKSPMADLEGLFNAGSHNACGCDINNDDAVQKFMDMATEKFGIETQPVKSRVLRITIKSASEPKTIKKVIDKNTVDGLARSLAESHSYLWLRRLTTFNGVYN